MPSARAAIVVLSLASTVLALPAGAHEFWIRPDAYAVTPGELVRVRLFHGERFAGDVVPRDEAMIARFEMVGEGGGSAVRGLHTHEQSFARPESSGVIVYESREYVNILPGPRFEEYLEEEGLGEISRRRAEAGESGTLGREAYVRCAKAIVAAVGGDAGSAESAAALDREVGLPCEVVLVSLAAGGPGDGALEPRAAMTVRVLFEGAPLAGARVVAVAEGDPGALIEARTDADGLAQVEVGLGGPWMVTTLHMVRTTEREDVDWKSYWASLTFEIDGLGAGPDRPVAPPAD